MPAGAVPAEFLDRMRRWRCGSGTFRMNVALAELPDFACLPGRDLAEHHTAGIIVAPSLALPMKKDGKYSYYRLGISPSGVWHYFIQ